MHTLRVANVSNKRRVLIRRCRICAFRGVIVNRLPVLSLIACDHVNRLLYQVEVEVLIGVLWREIIVTVNIILRPRVKERVYVGLVPSSLFNRLEFSVQIVKPLTDASLTGLEIILPWGIVESNGTPQLI